MLKQILNTTICSLALLLGSCSFLEVEEKGVVSETKMFKDVGGFEAAMYGIYANMGSGSLYGETLTFGFVEEICYQYHNLANDALKKTMAHDYLAQEVRPTIDNIWNTMYQTLSYINNVIKFTKNGVLKGEDYANIRGEALGLRAYIHFDLLRLFAKSCEFGEERGIPYQTEFSSNVPPASTIKKTCELIVADLIAAEELLNPYISNYTPDLTVITDYARDRNIHFNIYAIKATLARVYLYMGENGLAADKAFEVIDSKKFPLLEKTEIQGKSCHFPNGGEAIFGIFVKNVYASMYPRFVDDAGVGDAVLSIRWLNQLALEKLYEVSSYTDTHKDYRYTSYFDKKKNSTLLKRFGNEKYDPSIDVAKVIHGVTLIQVPEMYYIYAEAMFDKDKKKAIDCFNTIVNSRGLRNIDEMKPVASKDEFIEALYNERRKEYFGTGVMFFESKRLNKSLIDHDKNVIPASEQIYVLPWPEQEKEFGTAKH